MPAAQGFPAKLIGVIFDGVQLRGQGRVPGFQVGSGFGQGLIRSAASSVPRASRSAARSPAAPRAGRSGR
ncbi:hypothetical protein ACFQ9X_32005 [Catenulispora yoronensis]